MMLSLALLYYRFDSFSALHACHHTRPSRFFSSGNTSPASLVSTSVVEVGQGRNLLLDKQKPTQSCKSLPRWSTYARRKITRPYLPVTCLQIAGIKVTTTMT